MRVVCQAIAALTISLAMIPEANAQIGLSHAKKGSAYLSVESGYQHNDSASASVPTATGTNPYPSGLRVTERAYATPNGVSSSSSVSDRNNTASSNSSAGIGMSSSGTSTSQVDGQRSVLTNAQSQGSASPSAATTTGSSIVTITDGSAGLPALAVSASGDSAPGASSSGEAGATAPNGGNASASSSSAAGSGPPASSNADAAAAALPPNLAAAAANASAAQGGMTPQTSSATAAAGALDGTFVSGTSASSSTLSNFSAASAVTLSGGPSANANASYAGGAPSAFVSDAAAGAIDKLNGENGALGGLTIGFVLPTRAFGLIDRIELYGALSETDKDANSDGTGFAATSADGKASIALFDSAGLQGSQSFEERHTELGLRLKSDSFTDTQFPLIVSFEPFYRKERLIADSSFGADYGSRLSADADMYGAQVALETEIPLSPQSLSFIGRIAGGIYAVQMDGRASERIGTYALTAHDDDTATGYRVGAEAGVRLSINETSFASLTGEVDHLSQAPSLKDGVASLDSQTDYRAKLTLTFKSN